MDVQNLIVTLIFIGATYASFLYIVNNFREDAKREKETVLTKKNCTQNNCRNCH